MHAVAARRCISRLQDSRTATQTVSAARPPRFDPQRQMRSRIDPSPQEMIDEGGQHRAQRMCGRCLQKPRRDQRERESFRPDGPHHMRHAVPHPMPRIIQSREESLGEILKLLEEKRGTMALAIEMEPTVR